MATICAAAGAFLDFGHEEFQKVTSFRIGNGVNFIDTHKPYLIGALASRHMRNQFVRAFDRTDTRDAAFNLLRVLRLERYTLFGDTTGFLLERQRLVVESFP